MNSLQTLLLGFFLFGAFPTNINGTDYSSVKNDEQLFVKHADFCLKVMRNVAKSKSINGVSLVAFIPNDTTKKWISKMEVVNTLTQKKRNLLAIAYSKASEMAVTMENSGNSNRTSVFGEFGYKGGAIKKVKQGYILAVFSGGTGTQDFEIASTGVKYLNKFFK